MPNYWAQRIQAGDDVAATLEKAISIGPVTFTLGDLPGANLQEVYDAAKQLPCNAATEQMVVLSPKGDLTYDDRGCPKHALRKITLTPLA